MAKWTTISVSKSTRNLIKDMVNAKADDDEQDFLDAGLQDLLVVRRSADCVIKEAVTEWFRSRARRKAAKLDPPSSN